MAECQSILFSGDLPLRTCRLCKALLPESTEYFFRSHANRLGLATECKKCNAKRTKQWRLNNKERHALLSRQSRQRLGSEHRKAKRAARRRTVLEHYGVGGVAKCVKCGESQYEFLAIDHVNGGGLAHRKQIGANIYEWIFKAELPDGFRTLCHNCNAIAKHEKFLPTNPGYQTKHTRKRRMDVLKHYGGDPPQCACCGFGDTRALTIDHPDGVPSRHRKPNGQRKQLHVVLLTEGLPVGYRVLCCNCNMATGFYGACPHGNC